MFNIGNFTREDNPPWRPAQVTGPIGVTVLAPPSAPGPVLIAGRTGRTDQAGRARRTGRALILVVAYLAAWPAAVPRRLGDRLFTINDNEAYWRDWQTIRVHGGLGRRYRDPRFDTLTVCPTCRGATQPPRKQAACAPCLGTGRITVDGVN